MLGCGVREAMVMAPPTTCESAVSSSFHGCLAFFHRHFPPQYPPSHPLNLSLHSQQQQPSSWVCSTILKLQFPATVSFRGPVFLSRVCVAVARTVLFSFHFSQFNHSVVSNSWQLHGLPQARPPRPSLTPGVYSNACPLSHWCHPNILSSVVPFSSFLQSFPASGSFQMSWLFASGGQSIGVSASTAVLPMNIQNLFPLGWTGCLLARDSQESSPIPQFKSINSSVICFLYSTTLTSINDYWKNHSLD